MSSLTQSGAASADVVQFNVAIPVSLIVPLVSALIAAAITLPPDPRIDEIVATMKELKTMSQTISDQQDVNTGKIVSDLDAIKTGIADLRAQIAAGQGPVGSRITQAQEDALAAAAATADSMAAAFQNTGSVVNTGTTAVVFDASDPTPNAPGGRNTSGLPGFDSTLPETA